MKTLIARSSRGLGLLLLVSTLAVTTTHAATIIIQNNNAAGVGFNDPTPRAPVGGNPGTTLGDQRLYIFQYAADIWSQVLPSSVTIIVRAQFAAQTCTATSAVLGSAGAVTIHRDFTGAPFPGTWYNAALANKLFGSDLSANPDINATFNLSIDSGCFGPGQVWYYGVDGLEGGNIELLPVVLHEIGHGLGFQTFTSGSTGAYNGTFPSIADRFLYDTVNGLHWTENTAAQRVASAISIDKLAWDGPAVNKEANTFLGPRPVMVINSPAGIAGTYAAQNATFGAALTLAGASGNVVLVDDATAPNINDGCEAPINAAAIAGNFALVDRGNCTFVIKAQMAQAAGATGLIVANNVAAGLPGMGGADPSITIPCIGITQADGNAIKANLAGGVNVTMKLDPTQKAGMDANGRVLMYAPNPFASGSSVSHFDVTLSPNALMEPAINNDLHTNLDLTPFHFRDIGWFPTASVSLVALPPKGVCDEKVLLTATIAPVGEGKGVIEFLDGIDTLGVGDVINNTTATLSTTLSMGTHSLKALHKCYTCSTYVVSPEVIFEVNCPTAALLSLFRAVPTGSGIELRWQFGEGNAFVDSWIERATAAEGPWATIAAERFDENGVTVAVDASAVAGTSYWYRLVATQMGETNVVFGPLKATAGATTLNAALGRVYPNPGTADFRVDFTVARQANVKVSVHDVQGREVVELVRGSYGPGVYQAVWTGRTAGGKAPAGVYFVRYQAPDRVLTSPLVLR